MKHYIEYLFFSGVGLILRMLPLGVVQRLGAFAGEFAGITLGYRRSVTMDNLRNAFPDYDEGKLRKIMRASFRSVGTALFEFVYFPRLNSEAINGLVLIGNSELVKEVFARGKGIILLTAHFGNWELLAQSVPARTGIPVHVIVKLQANRRVDKQVNRWRTMLGNVAVPMESSVRELLKALREKKAVGMVGDQAASKESGTVRFFGREVPTFEGPAMFSLKTGAPLLVGFAVRQANGTYLAEFHEVPSEDLDAYTPENVHELTRRHVAITEAVIREHPEQWMWMHKRWKHVPSRIQSTDRQN
ncbi:MAG TPA: lysophospholipid acyltransferase family protein [Bacteroidota bacterium]